MESVTPRADLVRPLEATDGVSIPGPGNPAFAAKGFNPTAMTGPLKAVEIIKDHGTGQILVAGRCCHIGDVVEITPHPVDAEGRKLRLGADAMNTLFFPEHALRLIEAGYATATNKRPTSAPAGKDKDVETAVNPAQRQAERAVAPRQGRGAI